MKHRECDKGACWLQNTRGGWGWLKWEKGEFGVRKHCQNVQGRHQALDLWPAPSEANGERCLKQKWRERMSQPSSERSGEHKTVLWNDSELKWFHESLFHQSGVISMEYWFREHPRVGKYDSFLSDGRETFMRHLAALTEKNGLRRGRKMAGVSWGSEVLFQCTHETSSLNLPEEILGKVGELQVS